MIISTEARELIAKFDALQAELYATITRLDEVITKDTGDKFGVCTGTPYNTIQLTTYGKDISEAEALSRITESADDGEVKLSANDQFRHYSFKMDKHPFVILFDTEDNQ